MAVWHLDVDSSHPGAGENISSLLKGNFEVINKLKTVNAIAEIINKSIMVNAVGKERFEASKAYLAGFLDADGAIMATIEKHKEMKFGFRLRVILKVTQKNREILDSFFNEYQVGKVVRNRTTFDWLVKDQQSVIILLNELKPYLRLKLKQAILAIDIIKKSVKSFDDLLEAANLADALAKFNVRSTNRRKNTALMIKEFSSPND